MPQYTRLSSAIGKIRDHYEVVVVGSGYGGGIAASRLARAGRDVCLLERGKERVPGEFPQTELEALDEMRLDTREGTLHRDGLFDMRFYDDINVLVGSGLGGTSLINANVSIRPDPRLFDDPRWPQAIRDERATSVAEGYDRAHAMLRPNPVPADVELTKLRANERSAQQLGAPFHRTDLNVTFDKLPGGVNHVGVPQPPCNHCGDCITGCNYGSKNTTLATYLPDAVNHGAAIYTEIEVRRVARNADGTYVVYYRLLDARRASFDAPDESLTADIVVLAAGTLGSTEILLRSRREGLATSAQVGAAFTGNGDVLGFGYNCDVPIHGVGWGHRAPEHMKTREVGACITSCIDLRGTANPDDGMLIEEGSLPGAIAGLLPAPLAVAADLIGVDTDEGIADKVREVARKTVSFLGGPYHGAMQNTQTYLVMTHEQTPGQMRLDGDRLEVTWPGVGDEPIFERVNERLIEATRALGGTFVKNPLWTPLFKHRLVTVHPLGGCVLADDAAHGVVNHKGQVFAGPTGTAVHDGLYVCDGSIIPRSLGCNPLLTISALSERACAMIAADRGWTIDYALRPVHAPPPPPATIGVEFTERMAGHFSRRVHADPTTHGLDAFLRAEQDGKEHASPFEFIVTIAAEDVDQLVRDERYESGMLGTVRAPALSKDPLMVTEGRFTLLVTDPTQPRGKNMRYRMKLTASDGAHYWFEGTKYIKDDPGFDVWSDCTTLYITVSEGGAPGGAQVGCGVLHIAPLDFLKQLRATRAINANSARARLAAVAKFGAHFAGTLWQVYGGVFARATAFKPDAPPRKKRALRASAPEVHDFVAGDGAPLRLTRYRAGGKGPVMLVHDVGTSSQIFAIDTIETNLLEYLCERGYDAWLLDHRASIERTPQRPHATCDDIAREDLPAAVARMREVTGARTVQVVAHGTGAAAFAMAMLAGLDGVRSSVLSQLALHIDASKPDAPPCERAACQRIAALHGPAYQHDQLDAATHDALHELFGDGPTAAFEHVAQLARHGHLVAADGSERYMDQLARMALPTLLLHGADNRGFLPSSTERSLDELSRANGEQLYQRVAIPGYGHSDCVFGAHAARDVFPHIAAHLEANQPLATAGRASSTSASNSSSADTSMPASLPFAM